MGQLIIIMTSEFNTLRKALRAMLHSTVLYEIVRYEAGVEIGLTGRGPSRPWAQDSSLRFAQASGTYGSIYVVLALYVQLRAKLVLL